MKSLIHAVVAAAVLIIPVASFAQTDVSLTRAQVRGELIQLEKAGYRPGQNDLTYPVDLQAAEARVAAQHARSAEDVSGYGADADGSSQSGLHVAASGARSADFSR